MELSFWRQCTDFIAACPKCKTSQVSVKMAFTCVEEGVDKHLICDSCVAHEQFKWFVTAVLGGELMWRADVYQNVLRLYWNLLDRNCCFAWRQRMNTKEASQFSLSERNSFWESSKATWKDLNFVNFWHLFGVYEIFSKVVNNFKTIKLTNCIMMVFFAAEDPSESYVKLRDYVLVKLCQGLPSFAADKLPLGFSADMVTEAQDKLKINKV